MIVKKTKCDLYPYDFIFIFNDKQDNDEEITNLLSKHQIYITEQEGNDWVDNAKGWTLKNVDVSIIILNVHLHKNRDKLLSTLRHEIHHAAANCFAYICNPITILDEEVFLYLNDWLFMTGIDLINKNKII